MPARTRQNGLLWNELASFKRWLVGAALGDPSRPRDQLASAVGTDMGHRFCAGRAEGALIGADECGPFGLEACPAPFTLGPHLEWHWGFVG